MKTGVDVLEKSVREAQGWITSVARRLNTTSATTALQALKATLLALRGQLDRDTVIRFGGALPPVLRALFYDGWAPSDVPKPATHRETFLGRVEGGFARAPRIKAERAAKAALGVICERLPAAVMAPVVDTLPPDLAQLWPDEPVPYTDLRGTRPLPPDLDEARKSRASPSRLRRATRRAPGDVTANALPERHRSRRSL